MPSGFVFSDAGFSLFYKPIFADKLPPERITDFHENPLRGEQRRVEMAAELCCA